MDSRWLETFVAVADEGSLVAAADALQYARSTVTHHVQSLERELGATLVSRSRSDRVLTPAGEDLIGRARRILDELRQARLDVGGRLGGRRLRVGATDSAGAYRLPTLLKMMSSWAPDVEIVVEVLPQDDVESALDRRSIGLALFTAPRPVPTEHAVRAWREEPVLVCSGTGAERTDQVVLSGRACPYRRLVEEEYLAENPGLRRLQVGSLEAVRGAVLRGLGVGLLPLSGAAPWLDAGSLATVPSWRCRRELYTMVRWDPHRCPQEIVTGLRAPGSLPGEGEGADVERAPGPT